MKLSVLINDDDLNIYFGHGYRFNTNVDKLNIIM